MASPWWSVAAALPCVVWCDPASTRNDRIALCGNGGVSLNCALQYHQTGTQHLRRLQSTATGPRTDMFLGPHRFANLMPALRGVPDPAATTDAAMLR